MIFHSQTQYRLWLETKLSFLTSTEALRYWVIFIKQQILIEVLIYPKSVVECFEIVQFSEISTQSLAIYWLSILVNNNSGMVSLPHGLVHGTNLFIFPF